VNPNGVVYALGTGLRLGKRQPVRSRLPDVQPDIAFDVRRHEDLPPEKTACVVVIIATPGIGCLIIRG
jgi:hypothetical protein